MQTSYIKASHAIGIKENAPFLDQRFSLDLLMVWMTECPRQAIGVPEAYRRISRKSFRCLNTYVGCAKKKKNYLNWMHETFTARQKEVSGTARWLENVEVVILEAEYWNGTKERLFRVSVTERRDYQQ